MEILTDLKAILHSKRANIYYLEKCRIMQKDGRILYLTETKNENQYWNIPIANTTCLLLGTGTSITQAAIRMLAQAGVLVGFCGGEGTPLLMATEVEWLTPQSEYRPTEYMQGWMRFWFNDKKRLCAAKQLQRSRIDYLRTHWEKCRDLVSEGFSCDDLQEELLSCEARIQNAVDVNKLLYAEAELTKKLYRYAASRTSCRKFTREREATDKANTFLTMATILLMGWPQQRYGCLVFHTVLQ